MSKIDLIGRIVQRLPKREFNGGRGEKVINFFSKHVSVPESRVIIGASMLACQPFIDLYNKDVDEKTRIISCAKTIAKNVVGIVTGFSIRAGFIKFAQNYSQISTKIGDKEVKNARKIFTPSIVQNIPNVDKTHAYRQYQSTMGTLLAVAGMVFTNFLVDAPLTILLTNALMKRFGVFENPKAKAKGVQHE